MITSDNNSSEACTSDSTLARFLRDHNVNPTKQRLAIAYCMLRRKQHLTAENILSQVNCDDTRVSKATVYNTLRLFVDQGILREVVIDSQRTLFDSNVSEHHHVVNIDTGEIRDIDPIELPLPAVPGLFSQETIEGVDLVLRVRTTNPQTAPS